MSATRVENTSNKVTTNYDVTQTFLGATKDIPGEFTNGTGDVLTIEKGTLVGRIADGTANEGKIAILKSGSTDGSEIALGFIRSTRTLADGETAILAVVVGGEIDESEIVLDGTDTLDTVIDKRSIRDRILGDTYNMFIRKSIELSEYDNF